MCVWGWRVVGALWKKQPGIFSKMYYYLGLPWKQCHALQEIHIHQVVSTGEIQWFKAGNVFFEPPPAFHRITSTSLQLREWTEQGMMFKLLLAWHSASNPSQVHSYCNNQQGGRHNTTYNMFFQWYCRKKIGSSGIWCKGFVNNF